MIDTIIFTLAKNKFLLARGNDFGLSVQDMLREPRPFAKFYKNARRKANIQGKYPRLTFIKRGRDYSLKVELSVGKVLFGNNLREVDETYLDKTIKIVRARLEEMGVMTYDSYILEAPVSSFHPSKNFLLTGGWTASAVLRELSKVNLTARLDITKDQFRNEGHSLQYHAISHSFVVYDKIADLFKTENKSISRDQKTQQLSLFDYMQNIRSEGAKDEVIRFEVRLSNKRKMNDVLRKLDYKQDPSIKDVFKDDLCQKIIKLYWSEFVQKKSMFLFDMSTNPKNILKKILLYNPRIKPKDAIYKIGLVLLCKDEGGIRELRAMLEPKTVRRNWYRIDKDIKAANNGLLFLDYHGWVKQIMDGLKDFEPINTANLSKAVHNLL